MATIKCVNSRGFRDTKHGIDLFRYRTTDCIGWCRTWVWGKCDRGSHLLTSTEQSLQERQTTTEVYNLSVQGSTIL